MRERIPIGARVRTPFGDGTIAGGSPGAYLVKFEYLAGPIQVDQDEVEFLDDGPGDLGTKTVGHISDPPPHPEEQSTQDSVDRIGLRTIEALRFGLVPQDSLRELTVGYEKLQRWIVGRLPLPTAGVSVSEIHGPFGTGKSHAMAVIRQVALEEGYVVANVEVDGSQISLSQPKALLGQLWPTIRANGLPEVNPVVRLHERAIGSGGELKQREFPTNAPNFRAARALVRTDRLHSFEDEIESILTCGDDFTPTDVTMMIRRRIYGFSDERLVAPVSHTIDDRPRTFLESLLSMARLSELAGFKGLVVTVDEFEVEYGLSLGMRSRVAALIQVICEYLRGNLEYPKVRLGLFFATCGVEGHEGDEYVDDMVDAGGGEIHDLRTMHRGDRRRLAERIHERYVRAYEQACRFDAALVEEVEATLQEDGADASGLVRSFIKRYVARLDRDYGPSWKM